MISTANIIEIFSSIQGEGTRLGEQHLFIRFQDCELSCQFCDTPASFVHNERCRVETTPFTKKFTYHSNPFTPAQINNILSSFDGERVLSITGGEPLQQADFLAQWLPTLAGRYQILLETAGIHYQALEKVLDHINIISMDIKLPSVTNMRPYWEEHQRFLVCSRGKERCVKVVVSSDLNPTDLERSYQLIAAEDPAIPFILQPATPFASFRASPSPRQLNEWAALARQTLSNVRIIPQLHKTLKVL